MIDTPDYTPFVRVYFNDGTGLTVIHAHPSPLTKAEANELFDSYDGLDCKHVITIERTDSIDSEYDVFAYNLVGSLIYEWHRKENKS